MLRVILTAFLLLALPLSQAAQRPIDNAAFQKWLWQTVAPKARKAGVREKTLKAAFKDLTLDPRLIHKDRNQSEFMLTFAQYYRRAVTPERVRKGRALMKEYKPILERVTRETGVPGRFLIAFWGMETNYGGFTGNTPIIRALATLAYEGRREKFFTRELIAALKIVQNNHFKLHQMKGSWAGAMGQVQFMPSNYLRYGRDGNGDGRVDLWNTMEDAFLSAGYFLAHLGWHTGETWGREVRLTPAFKRFELTDGLQRRSLASWAKLGVVSADGRPLPQKGPMAALSLPMGQHGPAFLLYPNFYVIRKWNRSDNYALSVGLLADALIGRTFKARLPEQPEGIPRARLRAIQQALNAQGYSVGTADGVFGRRSRSALRKWQQDHEHPADGWPSETIWWKLHAQQQQRKQAETLAEGH